MPTEKAPHILWGGLTSLMHICAAFQLQAGGSDSVNNT